METSYNGWTASPNPADFGGLTKLVVAGEEFAPGVRSGDVFTVFQYLATRLHREVEPIVKPDWHQADDWGYSYRKNVNANNLSCHASGTAIDYNATRHPNDRSGTFSSMQVATIHRILLDTRGVVAWGGDFKGRKDEMHFEISGNWAQVRDTANWIRGVHTPDSPDTSGPAVLEYGQRGPEILRLQQILTSRYPAYAHWYPLTDYFGPQTLAAVREFQRRSHLVVDGIVGPATRRALGM